MNILLVIFLLLFFPGSSVHASLDNLVREGSIGGVLTGPTGVAVDSSGGLYVTESGKNRMLVFSPGGVFLSELKGLDKPLGVAVDGSGKIYVSDAQQSVRVYDGSGSFLKTVNDASHPLRMPLGIAINRSSGKLYIASLNTSTVEVYGSGATGSGTLTFSRAGGSGCSAARASSGPSGSPSGFLLPLGALSIYLRFRGKFSSCARKRGGSDHPGWARPIISTNIPTPRPTGSAAIPAITLTIPLSRRTGRRSFPRRSTTLFTTIFAGPATWS